MDSYLEDHLPLFRPDEEKVYLPEKLIPPSTIKWKNRLHPDQLLAIDDILHSSEAC